MPWEYIVGALAGITVVVIFWLKNRQESYP